MFEQFIIHCGDVANEIIVIAVQRGVLEYQNDCYPNDLYNAKQSLPIRFGRDGTSLTICKRPLINLLALKM